MMGDPYFSLEYGENEPVPADIEFADTLTLNLGGVTAQIFCVVSPHTADSVCIHVPEERALFLGDAIYGDFNRGWYLPSHAHPHTRQEILKYLNRKLEQTRQKGAG